MVARQTRSINGNGLLIRFFKSGYALIKRWTTAQATVAKCIGKTMQGNGDNAFLKHDPTGGRPTVNRNFQVLLGQPEADYVKWSAKH